MFEGFAADILTSFLGSYLDLTKEKLRISLWEGQSVLENVRLRPEALEHLQLPISIREGSVGKLRLQFPWGRWMVHGSPLIIELSDVVLEAHTRAGHEWEEGPANAREQAAKQAELAAAELAKLSQRSGWGGGALVEGLTSYLLNSLQLCINNVHVRFSAAPLGTGSMEEGGGGEVVMGIKFEQLAATRDIYSLPATVYRMLSRAPQSPHVEREIIIKGWQVYVTPAGYSITSPTDKTPPSLSANNYSSPHSTKRGGSRNTTTTNNNNNNRNSSSYNNSRNNSNNNPPTTDLVLHPVHAAMRVSFRHSSVSPIAAAPPPASPATAASSSPAHASFPQAAPVLADAREGVGGGMHLGVLLVTESIQLQISTKQLTALMEVGEAAQVWTKRHRYGRFRPSGWLSQHEKYQEYRQEQRLHNQRRALGMQGQQQQQNQQNQQQNQQQSQREGGKAEAILSFGEWQTVQNMRENEAGNSSSCQGTSHAYLTARRLSSQRSAERAGGQGKTSWSRVWWYALDAVLHDLRERWRLEGLPPGMSPNYHWTLALWQLRYVHLYKCKLEGMTGSIAASQTPKSPAVKSGLAHSQSEQGLGQPNIPRRHSLDPAMSSVGKKHAPSPPQKFRGRDSGGNLMGSGSSLAAVTDEEEGTEGESTGGEERMGLAREFRSGSAEALGGGMSAEDGSGPLPSVSEELRHSHSAELPAAQASKGGAQQGKDSKKSWVRRVKAGFGLQEGETPGFWGTNRGGKEEEQADRSELAFLETRLHVSDILRFRGFAEELMQQQHDEQSGRQKAAPSTSWVAWGVSGVSGFLQYVGGNAKTSAPTAPTAADIHQLHRLLSMDPRSAAKAAAASATSNSSDTRLRGAGSSSSISSLHGLPSVTEQNEGVSEGSTPSIDTTFTATPHATSSTSPKLNSSSSLGPGHNRSGGNCQASHPPMHLSAEVQVLCVSLSIRDIEQRDVGVIELGNVKTDFKSIGGKEGAQLSIQHVQVYDTISQPGTSLVMLCGCDSPPFSARTRQQQQQQQQPIPWQWWQTRMQPSDVIEHQEDGLSWHAGTKPKGTQPRSASSSSSSLFQAPPSGSPDVTLTYKKCTPVATTATTEGSQTISPSPATATAHGPLFSAMLAAVATPPASPAPQQGTHDTTQTGPVPSGIGSTTTNTGTTTDRQQQGGCSSSDANHRRMSGASAGGVCTVGSEKKEESGGFGALPPRPPLLMPAPSPIEVGVVVQPLQMLYQPRFLESIAGVFGALYMEGALEELVQRSLCELQGRHAQLVAKAQHLMCAPPTTQLSVHLKELTLVVEAPPTTAATAHNSSESTTTTTDLSSEHNTNSTHALPPPRLQVCVSGIMAETPPQWRYAHTSQRVQRALAYLQSSCGGYPSSASSNSLNNQQHSQFSASYTHDQALQDLEECLIYDHMDLSVSGLQLLHSGAEQYLSQVSASHDHHHQQQYIHEQQEQQSQEQQPTPLHSLMPPLQLHSSLAINRIPHDTTLPATRAGMEVGGWGCASLTATQVAQLQSVLAMFQQQPQSQQQQQQTQQQQQQPSSSISSAADHAASLSTSAAGIQQKPPPAQTHPAAVWGLPPLKLITQLHVKLLPISVSYTEDTAMHSSSNSNSSSNIWQHSSEYQQHSRRAQQSRSEASACTLHLGAADAQVTLQGPDVEVHATLHQLQLHSNHASYAAAVRSTGMHIRPWVSVAQDLQIKSLVLSHSSQEAPLPTTPSSLPSHSSTPLGPSTHTHVQLTGLECHGYAGQPGRFITGACGVAGGLEEGPVLTATITSNPARASAHTAECRHSTEAAAQAESRQGTEVAGDAASAAATQVFVGVENMAVGVDLIAALMGAAESVAGAGTAVSTTATSVADETTVSAEGSSSSSAVGASTEGKGTAANETVAFHARLDNLSLLSVSDISGTGLGSSSTINSTGSRGSSSASLHCQALLSLSHLQCCWPPPSPSHSFSNPNTIDSNPPSDVLLLEGLMACVADQAGSPHLAPILLIPRIQVTQMEPSEDSTAAAKTAAAAETSTEHSTAASSAHQCTTHGTEPALSLSAHIPGIFLSLGSPAQADVMGSVAARLQQQSLANIHNTNSNTKAPAPSSTSATATVAAAKQAVKGSESKAVAHMPPSPPMRAQLQLDLLEAWGPACPVTARDQMVHLAWRAVAVLYVSSTSNSNSSSASVPCSTVTAGLQWQQLSVDLSERQCCTPEPEQQQQSGTLPDEQAQPHTSSSHPAMTALHSPSLSVMSALSARHARSSRSSYPMRQPVFQQAQQQQPAPNNFSQAHTDQGQGSSYSEPGQQPSTSSAAIPFTRRRTRRRAQTQSRVDAGAVMSSLADLQASPQGTSPSDQQEEGFSNAPPLLSHASSFYYSFRTGSSSVATSNAAAGFPGSVASSQLTSPSGSSPTGRSEDEFYSADESLEGSEMGSFSDCEQDEQQQQSVLFPRDPAWQGSSHSHNQSTGFSAHSWAGGQSALPADAVVVPHSDGTASLANVSGLCDALMSGWVSSTHNPRALLLLVGHIVDASSSISHNRGSSENGSGSKAKSGEENEQRRVPSHDALQAAGSRECDCKLTLTAAWAPRPEHLHTAHSQATTSAPTHHAPVTNIDVATAPSVQIQVQGLHVLAASAQWDCVVHGASAAATGFEQGFEQGFSKCVGSSSRSGSQQHMHARSDQQPQSSEQQQNTASTDDSDHAANAIHAPLLLPPTPILLPPLPTLPFTNAQAQLHDTWLCVYTPPALLNHKTTEGSNTSSAANPDQPTHSPQHSHSHSQQEQQQALTHPNDQAQQWCSAPCLAVHLSVSAAVEQGLTARVELPGINLLAGHLALQHTHPAQALPLHSTPLQSYSHALHPPPWAAAVHCAQVARLADLHASCSMHSPPALSSTPTPTPLTPLDQPTSIQTSPAPLTTTTAPVNNLSDPTNTSPAQGTPSPPGTPPQSSPLPQSFTSPTCVPCSPDTSVFLSPATPSSAPSMPSTAACSPSQHHTSFSPSVQPTCFSTPAPHPASPLPSIPVPNNPPHTAHSTEGSLVHAATQNGTHKQQDKCQLAVRVSASELSLFAVQGVLASTAAVAAHAQAAQEAEAVRAQLRGCTTTSSSLARNSSATESRSQQLGGSRSQEFRVRSQEFAGSRVEGDTGAQVSGVRLPGTEEAAMFLTGLHADAHLAKLTLIVAASQPAADPSGPPSSSAQLTQQQQQQQGHATCTPQLPLMRIAVQPVHMQCQYACTVLNNRGVSMPASDTPAQSHVTNSIGGRKSKAAAAAAAIAAAASVSPGSAEIDDGQAEGLSARASSSHEADSVQWQQSGGVSHTTGVQQSVDTMRGRHSCSAAVSVMLEAEVYNARKGGWEPAVDAWAAQLSFTELASWTASQGSLTPSTTPSSKQPPTHKHLSMQAPYSLELTASPTLLLALVCTEGLLSDLQGEFASQLSQAQLQHAVHSSHTHSPEDSDLNQNAAISPVQRQQQLAQGMLEGVQSSSSPPEHPHSLVRVNNSTGLVLRFGCRGVGVQTAQATQGDSAQSTTQQQLELGPGDKAWLPAPMLQGHQPEMLLLHASTCTAHSTLLPTAHSSGNLSARQSSVSSKEQQLSAPGTEVDLGWMVLEVQRQLERQQELRENSSRGFAWHLTQSAPSPGHRQAGPSALSLPVLSTSPRASATSLSWNALAPPAEGADTDEEKAGQVVWASRRVQVKCEGWCSQVGATTVRRDYASVVADAPGSVYLLLVLSTREGSKVWDLQVMPALLMHNRLPVPVRVSALQGLHGCLAQEGCEQELEPCGSTALLGIDPFTLQAMQVQPQGFSWSALCDLDLRCSQGPPRFPPLSPQPSSSSHPFSPPNHPASSLLACQPLHPTNSSSTRPHPHSHSLPHHPFSTLLACHPLPITTEGLNAAAVSLQLTVDALSPFTAAQKEGHASRHEGGALPLLSPATGRQRTQQMALSLTSPLWAYNCTGMPIALRVAPVQGTEQQQGVNEQAVFASNQTPNTRHSISISPAKGRSTQGADNAASYSAGYVDAQTGSDSPSPPLWLPPCWDPSTPTTPQSQQTKQPGLLTSSIAQQQHQQQHQSSHERDWQQHEFQRDPSVLLPTLCGDLPIWDSPIQLRVAPEACSVQECALPGDGSHTFTWSAPVLLQPPPSLPSAISNQEPTLPHIQLITCTTAPPSQPSPSTLADKPQQQSQPSPLRRAPLPALAESPTKGLNQGLPELQPCPGYVIAACLQPVLSSPGSWALHLLTRHLVCNATDMPLRLCQGKHGLVRTGAEPSKRWSPLAPSQRQPLHWPAVNDALQLSISVDDTGSGWGWSCDVSMEAGADSGEVLEGSGGRFLSEDLVKVTKPQPADSQGSPPQGSSMLLFVVEQVLLSNGVHLILITSRPFDQAPYRIENDTPETLLVHQEGCLVQDAVHPYSSLPYAWDQPVSLQPLRLMVQLHSSKQWLGVFSLDQLMAVQACCVGGWMTRKPKKRFTTEVLADKATRVLRISTPPSDNFNLRLTPASALTSPLPSRPNPPQARTSFSPLPPPYAKAAAAAAAATAAAAASSARLMRSGSHRISSGISALRSLHAPTSTSDTPSPAAVATAAPAGEGASTPCRVGFGKLVDQQQQQSDAADVDGCSLIGGPATEVEHNVLKVEVEIAGVGVSVVGGTQELSYLAVGVLRGGVEVAQDKADLHFSLASLRCDNCLPDAAHPVAFAAPVIRSWWGPPILPPQPAPIPALPPLLSMHSQPLPCAAAGNSSSDTSSSTALQCTTAAGHATSSSDNTGSKNTTSSSRVGDVDSAKGVWTRGSRGLGMLTQRGVLTQRATSPQQSTAVSAHAVVCLNVPGHLLCCEHVSVSAAAMVANLDERQGRALLAHATQMRDVMVREQQARQARQQSGTVTQQQQQYQLQGTQQSAAATASVESCAGSAEDLQGQKLSLSGADHDRTTEITSASAPDTNSGSAAPHSVPTCVMGPLGAQPGLGMLADPACPSSLAPPKVYVGDVSISRVRLALSFTPASWQSSRSASRSRSTSDLRQSGQQLSDMLPLAAPAADAPQQATAAQDAQEQSVLLRMLLSLARLERAWITLKPLLLLQPVHGIGSLVQLLERHYRSGLLQLPLLLGSLDIFGDVTSLVQAWTTGMWHLLAMPARGALQGGLPQALAGFVSAMRDLCLRTTQASLNSSRKFSARARAAMATLCPYDVAVAVSSSSRDTRLPRHGAEGGVLSGSLWALGAGYRAWLVCVGHQLSLFSPLGVASQLPAALLLPCIVGLEVVEGAVARLRSSLVPRSQAVRVRVPRFVDPSQPLQRYDWLHAYCHLLHKHVADGAYAHETFRGCGAVAGGRGYVFVTDATLVVAVPEQANETYEAQAALVIPLSSLLWVSQEGQRLQLVHTSTMPLSLEHQKRQQASLPALTPALAPRQPSRNTQQQGVTGGSGLQIAGRLPGFLSGGRSIWGRGWGGQAWQALAQSAQSVAPGASTTTAGASNASTARTVAQNAAHSAASTPPRASAQNAAAALGLSRGGHSSRGNEIKRWLSSYPLLLGRPYAGAAYAARVLAGAARGAGEERSHDEGAISSNVPGWIGVSQLQLLDAGQAVTLHTLLSELLAAREQARGHGVRLVGFE